MAPKAPKPKLPDIPWSEDEDKLVWSFLTELEKDENYKVLFGKKTVNENTSGDSKTAVFKRIGFAILPKLAEIDAGTIANRKQAGRLRQTGGGLDENDGSSQSRDEELDYYIPADGPNASTPAAAVNLWQQIELDFKFFPRLHKIYAARPNVTPIVITTGVGPSGQKAVWYQSPNDEPPAAAAMSPAAAEASQPTQPTSPLRAMPASEPPTTPPRSFGTNITQTTVNVATPTVDTGRKRAPKTSTVSREAVEKARANIEKVPQKRTLLDTLIEIQEKNSKIWNDEAKEKILLQKRAHLLEEFKLGLRTKEEYHEKLEELEGGESHAASKRQKVRHVSPDWDDF
ncbi:hypothetical protein GALMADRAFT_59519 [Galerina marginata CBS 339.88]|uniref:Uncharacterized protein n=1 Tax=Galerina marginata (strain CBS 339.88) TaxID=685588 RepID=A0A067TQG4_GALM3|nr:hypothetical protein GALMADRAFT_59519 [Galerina marginata CBS 339.88]